MADKAFGGDAPTATDVSLAPVEDQKADDDPELEPEPETDTSVETRKQDAGGDTTKTDVFKP